MKKNFQKLTACLLAAIMAAAPAFASADEAGISLISDDDTVTLLTTASPTAAADVLTVSPSPDRVSVHDPSIVKDKDGTYYVFGSHIDAAKSKDLVNWVTFTNGYAATNNVLFGDIEENLAKPFEWAGCRDADASLYSVWAPDVFWNEDYINEDGTTGAYMMYFCTTSTYCRSAISYGVSQNIEGPYEYVDTLIYSGFTKNTAFDRGSSIDKQYANTNIDELIAEGRIDKANDDWFLGTVAYNTVQNYSITSADGLRSKDASANNGQEKEGGKEPTEQEVKSKIAQANKELKHAKTGLDFKYHEATKRVSITVYDKETSEVIREIPPEKSLDMLEKMWELAGMVVDDRR